MCGIAGIYNSPEILSDPEDLLKRMLARIQYRGPDENGIYINKHVALGSVRLSIIDIRSGQQPLSSVDGKYWIVFNGEIFNYIELKADLTRLGYPSEQKATRRFCSSPTRLMDPLASIS